MSFGLPTEYKNWFPFIYFLNKDFFISEGEAALADGDVKQDKGHSRKRLTKKRFHACPICGSRKVSFFIEGFDKEVPRLENYTYVECNECKIVSMQPFPETEKILSFYDNTYAPHQKSDPLYIKRRLNKKINRFLVKNKYTNGISAGFFSKLAVSFLSLFSMKNVLMPRGKKRLLDVGCGNGSFLYLHRMLGWKTKGIEINKQAAEHALSLGLDIENTSIYDLKSDELFDVITLHHVIEHVPDPVSILMKVKDLLAPDGVVYMSLPNVDALGFKLFKNNWFPLEAPRHLFQFSQSSIKKVVSKSGLEVKSLETEPQARLLWRSLIYRLSLKSNFSEIKSLRLRSLRINLFHHRDKNWNLLKKIFKKTMLLPLYISAKMGMGETMHLTLEKSE